MLKKLKLLFIFLFIQIRAMDPASYKANGYRDLGSYNTIFANSDENNGQRAYPYLKNAIKNFIQAIIFFIDEKKFKDAEEILKTVNVYKIDLSYEDQEYFEAQIIKLEQKINEIKKRKNDGGKT